MDIQPDFKDFMDFNNNSFSGGDYEANLAKTLNNNTSVSHPELSSTVDILLVELVQKYEKLSICSLC